MGNLLTMPETYQKHLDESIQLELNLATLYTIFNDCFAEEKSGIIGRNNRG